MFSLLVATYCAYAIDYNACEREINACVDRLNHMQYVDSQWIDVPNEEMSISHFKECAERNIK